MIKKRMMIFVVKIFSEKKEFIHIRNMSFSIRFFILHGLVIEVAACLQVKERERVS